MKNNVKVILSVVAVLAIIVLVGGGTYAYWSWSTSEDQRTLVTISVKGATMLIDGGGNISSSDKTLIPTTCTDTTNAIQRKIMVSTENQTNTAMTETLQLDIVNMTAAQGSLTDAQKAKLKWTLVELADETEYNATTWKGCATTTYSGTFEGYDQTDKISLKTTNIAASTTVTKYYELYLWLDSTYEHTNVGNTQSDPMQNLTLNLSWNGTLEQVHE